MRKNCKYYYKGNSLNYYCKSNNINPYSIYYLITKKEMKVDEAVDYYWQHKGNHGCGNLIYSINGVSVKSLFKNPKLYQRFCYLFYRSKDKNIERIYDEVKDAEKTN